MERLAQPIPRVKRDPVQHNCEVLNLDPWTHKGREGKRWRVEPDKVSAGVAMEPTATEKAIMDAVAQAARQRRAWALADPLKLYGETETIDDVVRRQDKTR